MANLKNAARGLLACLILAACTPESPQTNDEPETEVNYQSDALNIVRENTPKFITASVNQLKETANHVEILSRDIEQFLAAPTAETLKAAQQSWWQTAISYRAFFYFGHLSQAEPEALSALNRYDYQIAGYPIQPGFIDKFGDYPYSGLVFEVGFAITEKSLINQHGLTDTSEVVLGLYALEFMLFDTNGDRLLSDFFAVEQLDEMLKERGFENIAEIPANRRRQLLAMQADILKNDIDELFNHLRSEQSDGVQARLKRLSAARLDQINRTALSSTFTALMLEISEFSRPTAEPRLPKSIMDATFTDQQRFISRAIESAEAGLILLPDGVRAPIETQLAAVAESADIATGVTANNTTQTPSATGQESTNIEIQEHNANSSLEDAYWNNTFANLKAAHEHLLNGEINDRENKEKKLEIEQASSET